MLTTLLFSLASLLLLASIKMNRNLKQELQTKNKQLSKTLNAYKLVMVRMSELELKDALPANTGKRLIRRKGSGQLSIFNDTDEPFAQMQSVQIKSRPRPRIRANHS
jgi:hypothetical protein